VGGGGAVTSRLLGGGLVWNNYRDPASSAEHRPLSEKLQGTGVRGYFWTPTDAMPALSS